jgi:uncharacterized protein
VIKKTTLPLLLLILFGYCITLASLYFYQETLIFPGEKLADDHVFKYDMPFTELMISVEGATLNALHFRQKNPKGIIFFLHGNAGNLKTWATGMDFYQRVNYDLFMLDYRGYGKSTGNIQSQQQLMDDVRAAWNLIAADYTDKHTVIYGRSLGTALATQLALEVNPSLLVLVSPFTSMTAIAKAQYPFAPSFLLRYPLNTDQIIADVSSKTVFIHGSDDTFIPISHSLALQSIATAPTQFLTIDGANHSDIHLLSSYLDGLARVLPE